MFGLKSLSRHFIPYIEICRYLYVQKFFILNERKIHCQMIGANNCVQDVDNSNMTMKRPTQQRQGKY